MFAPSRGSFGSDPDLTASGGADSLVVLSAHSAHLGSTGPGSACCDASPTRSPAPTAHFGSGGAQAIMGFIWHPRPPFPTVELAPTRFPRPDRHFGVHRAICPPFRLTVRSKYRLCTRSTPPARASCARGRAPDQATSRNFSGFVSLHAVPPLPTYRSALWRSLDFATQKDSTAPLSVPWELASAGSPPWPKTPSSRNIPIAFNRRTRFLRKRPQCEFRLQTMRLDCNERILTLASDFFASNYTFNLTYRAAEGRRYLQIDLIHLTRHPSNGWTSNRTYIQLLAGPSDVELDCGCTNGLRFHPTAIHRLSPSKVETIFKMLAGHRSISSSSKGRDYATFMRGTLIGLVASEANIIFKVKSLGHSINTSLNVEAMLVRGQVQRFNDVEVSSTRDLKSAWLTGCTVYPSQVLLQVNLIQPQFNLKVLL
ncbi:hypothetical protein C8R43DRAFT_1239836, partial [Mycena crocata]